MKTLPFLAVTRTPTLVAAGEDAIGSGVPVAGGSLGVGARGVAEAGGPAYIPGVGVADAAVGPQPWIEIANRMARHPWRSLGPISLIPEGFDRLKSSCAIGWVDAKEQPDRRREQGRQQDGVRTNNRREVVAGGLCHPADDKGD